MRTLLAIALLASLSLSLPAKDFPGVQSLMSSEEFARAGLNKLNADEIKALDAWLIKYSTQDVPVLAKEVPALQQAVTHAAREVEDQAIQAKIIGEFKGWTGKTLFKLDNGQVWKQRQDGKYLTTLNNPTVRIEKNLMGFFEMEVVETGRWVGVKQLK